MLGHDEDVDELTKLRDKVKALELQNGELETLNREMAEKITTLHREREDALRLLREARQALEIASPSMAHTFSGHTCENGIPVEWVDGCGKCRVMAILMNKTEKRNQA